MKWLRRHSSSIEKVYLPRPSQMLRLASLRLTKVARFFKESLRILTPSSQLSNECDIKHIQRNLSPNTELP